jgi:hypothetical protein
MVGDYWRRVHRRAFASAAERIGLTTWERVVLNVLLVAGAIAALLFWGSADASRDELIVRIAFVTLIILVFPLFYLREFMIAPAKMEAEARDLAALIEKQLRGEIGSLEADKDNLKIQMTPEIATRSPIYLKLKFQLEPDKGNLSPMDRIKVGLEALQNLTDAVIKKRL